uniref:Uncharacterized protein n=1 Tax=Chrysemys picta bellii TaxID=8478 RepID=A0A8C3P5B7_CHRPI
PSLGGGGSHTHPRPPGSGSNQGWALLGRGGGRAEEAAGPEADEEAMERLAAALRQRLRGWEAALAAAQRLLVWERPLHSLVTAGGSGGPVPRGSTGFGL